MIILTTSIANSFLHKLSIKISSVIISFKTFYMLAMNWIRFEIITITGSTTAAERKSLIFNSREKATIECFPDTDKMDLVINLVDF